MYAVKNNTTVDGEVSVNQPPFGFFHLNEVWVQGFDELRLIIAHTLILEQNVEENAFAKILCSFELNLPTF